MPTEPRKTIGAGLHGSQTASTSDASVSAKEAEVWMPDPALRAAVREELALPADVPLTKDKMQKLRRLKAGGKGIRDIKGLEFARNLVNLHLGSEGNHITDLSPLATLTSLMDLNVDGNQITDLRPLVNLSNLTGLSLWNNRVTDVSPPRIADFSDLPEFGEQSRKRSKSTRESDELRNVRPHTQSHWKYQPSLRADELADTLDGGESSPRFKSTCTVESHRP